MKLWKDNFYDEINVNGKKIMKVRGLFNTTDNLDLIRDDVKEYMRDEIKKILSSSDRNTTYMSAQNEVYQEFYEVLFGTDEQHSMIREFIIEDMKKND